LQTKTGWEDAVNKQLTAAAAGIAGAGIMYFLDPVFGKRRRALLQEKARHFSKLAGRGMNVVARDSSHRIQGLVGESTHALRTEEVEDDVLVERVRSAMGRAVSHPHSIEVDVTDGWVTLSGPVLAEEQRRLLQCVNKVRGVQFLEDRLEPHQQRGTGRMPRNEFMRTNWTPAARAFAALTGMGAILFGAARRNVTGILVAGAGAMLMARGIVRNSGRRKSSGGPAKVDEYRRIYPPSRNFNDHLSRTESIT